MESCDRSYIAIDLKSFYASVECVERGLDPMTTNLVVADETRTEKTICLAASPSLRAYGVPGRARLFEVIEKTQEVNQRRRSLAPGRRLTGESIDDGALKSDPSLALAYIVAPPRMALYMAYSSRIYEIYLKYVAPEDIHVYSVDEVFIDATHYLAAAGLSARAFAMRMVRDVLGSTGITATAGIGTNLYLCKVAMDIVAKRITPDQDGVRIAELDEAAYRRQLWSHRPLTDFWRIGRGYAAKLESNGLFTMGDIARCSVGKANEFFNEGLLYRLFGINAELLIDHAWGWEPCTIEEIKAYRPSASSVGSGQVLSCPYEHEKAALIVSEMAEALSLDLVEKGLATDQLVISVGYDIENLTRPDIRARYHGPITVDHYGREVPKHAHGSIHLPQATASSAEIIGAALELYRRITDDTLLIRRVSISANHIAQESRAAVLSEQLDLFSDFEAETRRREAAQAACQREKNALKAVIAIKTRYGKNAILKGVSLKDGATAAARNNQIGGHKA